MESTGESAGAGKRRHSNDNFVKNDKSDDSSRSAYPGSKRVKISEPASDGRKKNRGSAQRHRWTPEDKLKLIHELENSKNKDGKPLTVTEFVKENSLPKHYTKKLSACKEGWRYAPTRAKLEQLVSESASEKVNEKGKDRQDTTTAETAGKHEQSTDVVDAAQTCEDAAVNGQSLIEDKGMSGSTVEEKSVNDISFENNDADNFAQALSEKNSKENADSDRGVSIGALVDNDNAKEIAKDSSKKSSSAGDSRNCSLKKKSSTASDDVETTDGRKSNRGAAHRHRWTVEDKLNLIDKLENTKHEDGTPFTISEFMKQNNLPDHYRKKLSTCQEGWRYPPTLAKLKQQRAEMASPKPKEKDDPEKYLKKQLKEVKQQVQEQEKMWITKIKRQEKLLQKQQELLDKQQKEMQKQGELLKKVRLQQEIDKKENRRFLQQKGIKIKDHDGRKSNRGADTRHRWTARDKVDLIEKYESAQTLHGKHMTVSEFVNAEQLPQNFVKKLSISQHGGWRHPPTRERLFREAADERLQHSKCTSDYMGVPSPFANMETQLSQIVREQYQMGHKMNRSTIKAEARLILQQMQHPLANKFAASNGWYEKFLKRQDLMFLKQPSTDDVSEILEPTEI